MTDTTITLTLTPNEFFILKDAVEELCNDSDLIWGGPDDSPVRYEAAGRLYDRLCKIEQSEVIPH